MKPWQKQAGAKLVVEYETGQLSARYAGMATKGAAIWSKSSCVSAVAVQKCTAGANCVTVVESADSKNSTDGETKWHGSGGYMKSATVTLYTQPLDQESDNGAQATVVHEMGHGLGLDHRLKSSDVMNANTDDNTNPMPDAVDFANLAALYGN